MQTLPEAQIKSFYTLFVTNHFLFMRKTLGIIFLLLVATYIQFDNTVSDIDYKVKNYFGQLPAQLAQSAIVYHVPGVVRIAGADIYRPEGYFTQYLVKLLKDGVGQAVGAIVKAMTVGIPTKLDTKKRNYWDWSWSLLFWKKAENGYSCLECSFYWVIFLAIIELELTLSC